MSVTTRVKYLLGLITFIVVALFCLGWCLGTSKSKKALNSVILAQNDTILKYKTELRGKTAYISQVEQELSTQKEAIKQGEIERQELRRLNLRQLNEISRLELKIDTLLTPVDYDGEVIVIHDTVVTPNPTKAILLPFTFGKKDEWLDLQGNFDKDGVLGVDLKLSFKADLWAGVDKTTKKNTAILSTDCKYIKTVSFNSIKLDTPKDKKYALGLSVGYGATLQSKQLRVSPFVGVSVTRILFRF